MPVEFWWWIEPLWLTGFLTVVIFGTIGAIREKIKHSYEDIVSDILMALAIGPWCICALSVIAWLAINVLVLIWR